MPATKTQGDSSRHTLEWLRRYESRNVTFIEPDGSWPIVWERARGVHVWSAEGNRYLDLTAAFGVAAAGHANSRVVRAGQKQMARLLHAMGDVHPHPLKARLARELSRLTFERWTARAPGTMERHIRDSSNALHSQAEKERGPGLMAGKTVFCNSGFEAVEAALKTAILATGRARVIAFSSAYHGLGYGALNVTARGHFRSPFQSQLREFGRFIPFPFSLPEPPLSIAPAALKRTDRTGGSPTAQKDVPALDLVASQVRRLLKREPIGAILAEPVQVRGGINVPPLGFLPVLRELCNEAGALLILDEVYTGFGRTGKWFACEHSGTVPDMICLGKAMTGGFPLSACVGKAEIMDAAWPPSQGEAIHTSTFLGHPVGCAMALAQMAEIRSRNLVERSAATGEFLTGELRRVAGMIAGKRNAAIGPLNVRGIGLLAGMELRRKSGAPDTARAFRIIKAMLHRGFILLPEGEHGNVISFTPPLTISRKQIATAIEALAQELKR